MHISEEVDSNLIVAILNNTAKQPPHFFYEVRFAPKREFQKYKGNLHISSELCSHQYPVILSLLEEFLSMVKPSILNLRSVSGQVDSAGRFPHR
jgi:hypothetical protein